MSRLISLKEIYHQAGPEELVSISVPHFPIIRFKEKIQNVYFFEGLLVIKKEGEIRIISGPFSLYYKEDPLADRLV